MRRIRSSKGDAASLRHGPDGAKPIDQRSCAAALVAIHHDARGIVPVLAIAAIYALLLPLGHGVMRLVAGPASADRLSRRPWEAA